MVFVVLILLVAVAVVALTARGSRGPTATGGPAAAPVRPGSADRAADRAEAERRARQDRAEREAREREIREREARALHDELLAVEAAARILPDGSPAAPVVVAGLQLAMQDRAAHTVAAGLRDPFPTPGPMGPVTPDGDAARPVEAFLEDLHRNAVAVAGVEQLALSALATAVNGATAASDALVALAAAPHDVATAAVDLVAYAQDPQAHVDVAHAVGAALHHAAGSILPSLTPFDLGLVGKVLTAVARDSGVTGTVASWAGTQVVHGLTDLAAHAAQAAQVVDAVANMEHAAGAVLGAVGIDAAFGSHIPVITAAVSGIREVRLLNEGRTTAAVAARNLALDVGGTGLGATIGGLAGGILGSVVPVVGNTVGAVGGAGVGGAVGRYVSNKVKGRNLRHAEEELDRVHEAYPGRLHAAAAQLHGVVVEQVGRAAADHRAALRPVPRLADRYGAELWSMTVALRAATLAHLDEVDGAVARARLLAAQGAVAVPDLTRTGTALAATRSAAADGVHGVDGEVALLALCSLAHAAPPVPPQGRLGARYRAEAVRMADRLTRLTATHAAEVRAWTTCTSAGFTERTDALGAALTPALATYGDRATRATAELGTATDRVLLERGRLGR